MQCSFADYLCLDCKGLILGGISLPLVSTVTVITPGALRVLPINLPLYM